MIRVKTSYLTIEWDPATGVTPGNPLYPQSYKIYFSEFGKSNWILLGSVNSSNNPYFTVKHSDVGDGAYVFAVRTVSVGGGQSPLHTSLDYTADPISGWYVWWIKNE